MGSTSAAVPTPAPTPVTQAAAHGQGRSGEIKIRPPNDFDGSRNKTKTFILDCRMYIKMNAEVYNTHAKQIIFVLSYMREGTAGPWKERWWALNGNQIDSANFDLFIADVERSFSPSDEEGDAKAKLRTLQMIGGMSADEYNTEFSTQAARCGITEDKALIEYYMAGLPSILREKILTSDNPPTNLQQWKDKASVYDNNYRRAKAITAHFRGINRNNNTVKKYNFRKNTPAGPRQLPNYDPNAMDVDRIEINRLSMQEKDEHFKKGLCFECHQPGHRASAHRAGPVTYQPKKEEVKRTPYQNIRAILAELGDEERNITLDQMEKEGF